MQGVAGLHGATLPENEPRRVVSGFLMRSFILLFKLSLANLPAACTKRREVKMCHSCELRTIHIKKKDFLYGNVRSRQHFVFNMLSISSDP